MIEIKRTVKTLFTVVFIIILILALGILIAIGLALQDDNTDKYNTSPSYDSVKNLAVSTALNNEAYISEKDLNSIVAYLLQKSKENETANGDYALNAVYFDINSDTPSRIYFQICYKDKLLGFSADIHTNINENTNNIEITFDNAKVGKLNIPNSFITKALSMSEITKSIKYLSVNNLTLTLPAHYSIEIENIGTLVDIDIESLQLSDGEIHIQTNPIAIDIANNIKSILGDNINSITDYFGDLF